jgi:ATP-dependent DNA helicase DinG
MEPEQYLNDPALGIVKESRPLQVELAKYLNHAISTNTPCAVEAGTGIGKSFAYLLNALKAAREGRRVIVSTAMKSLQQQLFFKDLPYLTEKTGAVKYARMLGKANYGCKRQVHLKVFDKVDKAKYDAFFEKTPHWIWEDGTDLPRNYYEYSVQYCNKARCPFFEECEKTGYLAAKNQADEARILVVNHALVGADMRVFAQHEKSIIGECAHLIVDEAHKFPEAVRNALACEMPQKFFTKATEQFGEVHTQLMTDLDAMYMQKEINKIPETLPNIVELEFAFMDMFRETKRTGSYGDAAHGFARLARYSLGELERTCGVGTLAFRRFLSGDNSEFDNATVFSPEIKKCSAAMQALYYLDSYASTIQNYANAIDLASTDRVRYVVAIETNERTGDSTIKTIPVEIGDKIAEHNKRRNITPAYLSATLTVSNSFEYFSREVGHEHDVQLPAYRAWETGDGRGEQCVARPKPTFLAGTPFNYKKQAWGYFPQGMPEPNAPDYIEKIVAESYDLLMANEGHAFVLFTSYKDMDLFANHLRRKNYPYRMLVQSAQLKANGRETFLSTPNATLLGTKSFWEGIDIPGLHLSLVVIPKLPFPHPGDAVMKAKSAAAGDAWFPQVSLPAMITDLRQMAGRLIRTTTDKGIVACLDSRIHTKGYGRQVIQAIGFPEHGSSKETALKLLRQLSTIRNKQKVGV